MPSSILRRRILFTVMGGLLAAHGASIGAGGQAAPPAAPAVVARFAREPNPIALRGPARPERYMEASGRKAALLGREDGSFEAWVYPLKVLHDFRLSFGTPDYAEPIPGVNLAASVDVRPEASVVRYAHAAFTVDAMWLVPLNGQGALILLDVTTSQPLQVVVKFRPDLKPMWPAALGGQYSYWDEGQKAYVLGEASGKHSAMIGSPFALDPPEQPAHNLPDAPSQFTIAITPETAARGLVPIVIAASLDGLKGAQATYQALLGSSEALYRESAAHYRRLREEMTSIDSPDDRLDLAFEWGKVALDKGFVCNPHLGCGLIAGLGPSGTSERPGFGWFFGGDAFINSWAMTAYGDFDTVKQSLDFLRTRQRADGKMMHELSQGAGYLKWFEEFPYGYYHADTTPLYIIAVRDYVRASGDAALAKDFWPSMKKAYDYCASTDEDGDGLMDNTKAGLAAVETGTLRRRDVLTDVFLGAAWTEAADAAAELAELAGDPFAATARAAAVKARQSLNARFLDDQGRRIYFAWMKDGKGAGGAHRVAGVWPLARRVRRHAARRRGRARRSRRRGRRRGLGRADALDRQRALRAAQLQQRRGVAVPDGLCRPRPLRERAPGRGLALPRRHRRPHVHRVARLHGGAVLGRPAAVDRRRGAAPALRHDGVHVDADARAGRHQRAAGGHARRPAGTGTSPARAAAARQPGAGSRSATCGGRT